MRVLDGVSELESVVGARPCAATLKSIDHLDDHCDTLLGLSPIAVLGYEGEGGAARSEVAGASVSRGPDRLAVPIPEGVTPAVGSAVSTVFLVPGLGETLRVNGEVERVDGGVLVVRVGEAFLHCAKCIIRSKLWDVPSTEPVAAPVVPAGGPLADAVVVELLARSPFVVLTSRDGRGGADASPKGDPPGFVRVLDGGRVAVPDRPGNRRTDTFHNLVEQPALGLLALVPGDDRIVEITGRASLTDDHDLLSSMAIGARTPKVALVLDVDAAEVRTSPALTDLWTERGDDPLAVLPDMNRVWVDHLKRNRDRGLVAKAIRGAVSERLVRVGIAKDYRDNLY